MFVSSVIQGRLTVRLALYWVLYHFVLWNVLFAYNFVDARFIGDGPIKPFGTIYSEFVSQYSPIIICAIAMLPIFLLDLVRLSHRIAGPLEQFKRKLRDMTAGKAVGKVRLRKGDLLTELEDVFNEYIEQYEAHRQNSDTTYQMSGDEAKLLERVVELKNTIDGQDSADEKTTEEPATV